MGKLIQKLIHGIVPSWLSKVKNFDSSHKKRLPFLKHGNINNLFSRKSFSLSNNNTKKKICTEEIRSEASESCSSPNIGSTVILLPSSTVEEVHESNSDTVEGSTETSKDCDMLGNDRQHGGNEDEEKHESSETGRSKSGGQDGVINGQHAMENGNYVGDESHKEAMEITDSSHESIKTNNLDDQGLWRSQILSSAKGTVDDNRSDLTEDESVKKPHQSPTKRKSGCLQEEDDEEEVLDEAFFFGDGGSAGSSWSSKRRRGMKEGLKTCDLPECVSAVVGNAKAVVKLSEDPGHAFWESMVEMIVGNGLWDTGNLEFLLHCYLTLNEPALHDTINRSFLRVLHDLNSTA